MRAPGSLRTRVFVATALLSTLSIGAAVFFVRARLIAELDAGLDRDLLAAANVVDQQQAALFDTFTRSARLLADLPRFKAAVDTGDPPTVQPIAEDYQRQLGADVLRVTGRRGQVLASVGTGAAGILRVVDVPITLDVEQLGVVTIGYLLNDARAAELRMITGADIAFASNGHVVASTLPAESRGLIDALPVNASHATVALGDSQYVALVRALPPAPGEQRGPSVAVLASRTARMRTLTAIQTFLAALALGAVLVAIGLSYWIARTVTRPLRTITDHMRLVAATGDLTRKIDVSGSSGWRDEDTDVLAGTFNTLTDSVARFQREAAQRERLSSLGRMSTVIAHEIRNPLMIIKGSLRTLAKGQASVDDVRDAAADIDGEIVRLNSLVNDVLDFARPIRFDCSSTDLNAACRQAALAVGGGAGAGAAVTVRLDASVPLLVTDGERLRAVLVNLLTNAQHAVESAGDALGDGAPLITLQTSRIDTDRAAIVIRDRGVGIAADDLPRIFDPYFTTRRAGTGLGLAIVKNIVDGLGGTLTVVSVPGQGTEFRLEVGHSPSTPA